MEEWVDTGRRILWQGPIKGRQSAAYAARWAAKHVVASGLATKCEIQLSYVIGVAKPVSVRAESLAHPRLQILN